MASIRKTDVGDASLATCPTCHTALDATYRRRSAGREAAAGKTDDSAYPFCCERCRLIDLGRWLSEEYRIPAGPNDN